jgi:NAD(P)-dependent dehydrogenase (short-subunit alcohol dehydrogenase family)
VTTHDAARVKVKERGIAMAQEIAKAVLITGCSTGIGHATAARMVSHGWRVYATARRPEAIKDLDERGCRTLALDVCDENSMRAAVETVEREAGAVGVLVNNAGYAVEGAIEEVPMPEVRRQFETNLFGLVQMTRLVLPAMRRQRWGRVINLSSMGGRLTLPGGGYYHATKYAVEAISDALRFEVAGFGIGVSIIEPGPIISSFGDTAVKAIPAFAESSPYAEFNRVVAQRVKEAYEGPMARMAGAPDDVAAVIERAASAARPRTRYKVTIAGRVLMALRRWLPDRAFDAFLKTQFPQPTG